MKISGAFLYQQCAHNLGQMLNRLKFQRPVAFIPILMTNVRANFSWKNYMSKNDDNSTPLHQPSHCRHDDIEPALQDAVDAKPEDSTTGASAQNARIRSFTNITDANGVDKKRGNVSGLDSLGGGRLP